MSEKAASPKSRFRIIVIIVIFLLLACFCLALLGAGRNKTVADRAYSWKTGSWIPGYLERWTVKSWVDDNCTVYIAENGEFQPYLVLTSNYGGNVLLLRKYLLPELMPFNKNERHLWSWSQYGGYYEDSTIDKYLNTDFINTLSQTTQDAIVNSDIVITDKSSMGSSVGATKNISRKVFILSLQEMQDGKNYASVHEGKTVSYFSDDYTRRVACLPNGEKHPCWTRTPSTWQTYIVNVIGSNGELSLGGADADIGVRPAFCLKNTTTIKQRTDIINGQTVYAIE